MSKSMAREFLESAGRERYVFVEDLEDTNFTLQGDGEEITTDKLVSMFGESSVLVFTDGNALLSRDLFILYKPDSGFLNKVFSFILSHGLRIKSAYIEDVDGIDGKVITVKTKSK